MKITNKSNGLRGVNTENGTSWLDPGETRDIDVAAGSLARVKANPDFAIESEANATKVAQPVMPSGKK